ncbi:MAG: CapA family protein [Clostridiales bacterium]|nr:CapA family protein [Clostridiales bacterium]
MKVQKNIRHKKASFLPAKKPNSDDHFYDYYFPENELSLNLKERVMKYKARLKPLSWQACCISIAILFAVLVGINHYSLRHDRCQESSSLQSLLAHFKSGSKIAFKGAFVGDIILGRSISQIGKQYGYDFIFKYAKDYFTDCNYVLGNFENPVLEDNKQYHKAAEKDILLSCSKNSLPSLKNAGFTLMGIANNHMLDYGEESCTDTLKAFDESPLSIYVGAGKNLMEAANAVVEDFNGLNVSTIALADSSICFSYNAAQDDKTGVFLTSNKSPTYLEATALAASSSDFVIVFIHWGREYTSTVSQRQRDIGRELIDAGADIVVGSHSHTLQPVEIYRDGIIFYSLGNFVFDQGWSRTKDSCLLRFALSLDGERVFEAVPMRIENAQPAETKNPVFTKRIFRTLSKYLEKSSYKIENNRLYIYPPIFKEPGRMH